MILHISATFWRRFEVDRFPTQALAKLEAERRARLLMEQEQAYTSADLAGMKVAAHSAEALERGDALILTLEDEQILDYDKDQHGKLVGLKKDSGPQLVNQNRAQDDQVKKRRAELYEEAALHAGGAVADDYEFATGNAAGGSATLAKYRRRRRNLSPRKFYTTEYPRPGRGGAATRLRGKAAAGNTIRRRDLRQRKTSAGNTAPRPSSDLRGKSRVAGTTTGPRRASR